jgi:hypothetical protein
MKQIRSFLALTVMAVALVYSAPIHSADRAARDKVFILGEIRLPQMLDCPADLKLGAALGQAGGVSDFGATSVFVIRDGSVSFKTDTRRILKFPLTDDPALQPKDVVYVGTIANLP